MNAMDRYKEWSAQIPETDPLHAELAELAGQDAEIEERFYRELEFGTAGLRGIWGAGTNRMNRYVTGRATQGIAEYILSSGEDASKGVVLAYDCRYHSGELARQAAEIFAGNGIPSYIFPALRPTPELSFAIRRLHALSGINMTASHNPKEYNGYKVYWKDGAQISGAVGDGMAKAIAALSFFGSVKEKPFDEAVAEGWITVIGDEMDEAYLSYILSHSQRKDEEVDLSVPFVYTPLHGAGAPPMREVIARRGFTRAAFVTEQMAEDPEFTTVGYPNPEDPKAFALAEKLGRETGAELILATDPDADRMAIEVRTPDGSYEFLNGNQTGALLIAYMAESQKERGILPEKAAMVKSIVTGDFGRTICDAYGIRVVEALTGFKNICGRIPQLEEEGYICFFAYEESIGCAPDAGVRDKDGLLAGMLLAEMAGYYRKRGKTILEVLDALYQKYGWFAESQVSLVLEGIPGKERIARIMDHFRMEYGGIDRTEVTPEGVEVTWDFIGGDGLYEAGLVKTIDYIDGYEDIPSSNVLKFIMADGSWFAMRPSGTEPKLKFYYYAVRGDAASAADRVAEMEEIVSEEIETIE